MGHVAYAPKFFGASGLELSDTAQQLRLAATEDGQGARRFLKARVVHPLVTAKALRLISEVVAARFYIHPSMLARILREADPVATVGQSAMRFEGFSACCSTYVRLDLDEAALETKQRVHGTTNVDFGDAMRAELAQIRAGSDMELAIGADQVEIVHNKVPVIEKKVPLPLRWIKGFGEVQVHLAGMEHAFDLSRIAAQRFLRSLPRSKDDSLKFLSVRGGQANLAARGAVGSVPLRGAHRLSLLEPLAAHAERLKVYYNPRQGSSAWVLDFGPERLCLVLNAEPWRGFSGDGGLLYDLAKEATEGLQAVRAQLNWQDGLEISGLAEAAQLPEAAVKVHLATLAGQGLVGFDLETSAWFHRVLPFHLEKLVGLNPRLKSAMDLVEAKAVSLRSDGAADVQSKDVVHRVEFGEEATCTCPWFAKHQGARGPCKHILAAEMVRGEIS